MCERCDDLEEALTRIAQWADAYPINIFREPTPDEMKRAHRALKEHVGIPIDVIAAYAARYALKGVGDIAKGVLPDYKTT